MRAREREVERGIEREKQRVSGEPKTLIIQSAIVMRVKEDGEKKISKRNGSTEFSFDDIFEYITNND